MILYQADILLKLKNKGFSSYVIRQERLMSQRQLQDIRQNKVTLTTLNIICTLLQCQPGDVLVYTPDDDITQKDLDGKG